MVLDFEYGVNTGNRFLEFVDHDEEPEDFIAAQTKEEEKQQKKLSTKDAKQASTKKVTTKTSTTTTTSTKTNKENFTSKTSSADQRRQPAASTAVFSDNNQQTRANSARGSRGGSRRGGPPYEGAGRGRSQRFNKFEGKGSANESSAFEQAGEGWSNEVGARGGRGRGGQRGGNFEGGRGRGRGRGGRGNFSNRNEDGTQQDDSNWQQTSDSNFDQSRPQYDQDVSPTERSFEPDNTRRANRGSNRGRTYRNYSDRDVEGQEDYRANRRQFDRQPRSFVSGVKPIEKKDGEGAHNWGNPTENPEDHPISDEITETTAQPSSSTAGKDWSTQVDEAEKQMTLDEYKKQIEERKRAQQEKLPQFNRRAAGEGEDPKQWQKFEQEYRKRNDDDEEEEEEEEGDEENESGEEDEEEQYGKKKNLITIPLRFKPIELQRGGAGSRGGPRRGGAGGTRYRSARDDQPRSTSPNQGPSNDDQQKSYRGGRPSGGAGDQRRSNRGGYRPGRSNADPNAPALDNPEDFPTLPKQ